MNVVIKLLPDGSGRVRIHWFVRTDDGPIQTPGNSLRTAIGVLNLGGARGYIACQPERKGLADVGGGRYQPCVHSDDPRAITCPECQAAPEYAKAMAALAEIAELPLTTEQYRTLAQT